MKVGNINIDGSVNSTERTKTKNSKELNSFDRMLSKMAYENKDKSVNTSSKEMKKVASSKSDPKDSSVEETATSKVDKDDSLKTIPKEVKEKLKEAGMDAEDVDKVGSLEDLKQMVEPDKLLAMLLSLMNLNTNSSNVEGLEISNLEGKIEKQIEDIFNTNLQQNTNVTDKLQLKDKVIDKLFAKVTQEETLAPQSSNVKNDDLVSKIEAELIALSSNSQKELKVDKKDIKDIMSDLKLASKSINGDAAEELKLNKKDEKGVMTDEKDVTTDLKQISKNLNGSAAKETISVAQGKDKNLDNLGFNSNSKSEDDFLKNILSDSNDKISKVTSFMSHLSNMKVDNSNVVEGEKLVINKNTLNADIIKTLKFMQINNKSDLTVKIMPKELGEVIISLTVEAGVMKGTITAANKEAYNLINSNLMDITNKLQNNDIKIENLTLNIYNEDTTFFKNGDNRERSDNGQQKERKTNSIGAVGEEISKADNLSGIDSNVDMLA
ncbi:flagellar hook-length control protein FliK [Clostridium sp. A1-XYC3]|uniref:Flagellar hook-length control protein FliK n=1 Tax=Clostridium tanneri TaxID=3037988 RepID=A0ABU4JNV8_9CLOT|nr:flagellar hook-length control protein FliK [Clostridium sp. A1-XYC3]MDW8799658.1 flagellar hook-length control protein FliK [Clostridium sp. A1-XYC3]